MLQDVTNQPQFSMVYALVEHRNDAIKCHKTQVKPLNLRLVVSLQSFEHFMVSFLWSIRV